jgi:hypothetical protein
MPNGPATNYDAIGVAANVTVPQAGNYRLTLELANTSPGVTGDDAIPEQGSVDAEFSAAGTQSMEVVIPATSSIKSASVLSVKNVMLYSLDEDGEEKSVLASTALAGNVNQLPAASWEKKLAIASSGHTSTLIDQNGTSGAEILRISVALSQPRSGQCGYSASLTTASNQTIQSINGSSRGPDGGTFNTLTLDFSGPVIYRAGSGGPYKLSKVFIECSDESIVEATGVFQTPSYTLNQFESTAASFTFTLSKASVTMGANGKATLDAIITPSGGFAGIIAPSISGLPTGVQVVYQPIPGWFPITNRVELRAVSATAGTSNVTLTLTSGAIVRTANLSLTISSTTIPVSVTADPSARAVIVDSTSGTGLQTFSWTPGADHTLEVTSPQVDGSGVSWIFDRWLDSGGTTRTVKPSSGTDYVVRFARDVTSSVQVTTGSAVYDANLGLWTRSLSIQNTSGIAISGPIYLILANISPFEGRLYNRADVPIGGVPTIYAGPGIGVGATLTGAILIQSFSETAPAFTYTPKVVIRIP